MPKSRMSSPSRTRWTATAARAVLSLVESSGLSVAEFASREGFDVDRLYRWRRRLQQGDLASQPAFVEVHSPVSEVRERIEVVLRSGHVLRVPESCDTVTLHRLLEVLDRESSC